MTAIEIMALIVAGLAAIKLVIVLISPKFWFRTVTKNVYRKPTLTLIISLVIAAVTLLFLLQTLTIVQIFAVMLFLMSLVAMGFAPYAKDMLELGDRILKNRNILKKGWLPAIVWLLLVIWTLSALFA